jgi:hypothetical protein
MMDMKKQLRKSCRHGDPSQMHDDQNHHDGVDQTEDGQGAVRAADSQDHAADKPTDEEAEDAPGIGLGAAQIRDMIPKS